jgi:Tfp pilus assembly protein PilF
MRIAHAVSLIAALAAVAAPARAAREQDLREAISVLEQAVKDHPANAELHTGLAFAYKKAGRAGDAQREFENAVKNDPSKAEAHYMLGLIYEKNGLKDKAKAAWQACFDAASEPGMKETARNHLHLLSVTRP